jgi:diacylglycerol kinase family enzyme
MKVAWLLHNPNSGKANHSKDEMISLVRSKGFDCVYTSLKKKDWDKVDEDVDFIIVAGGDGAVRNVARKLLRKNSDHKLLPLGILPLGTANNISTTIQPLSDPEVILESFHHGKLLPFDVGKVSCPNGDDLFFLESFGYGIFPSLMQKMEEEDKAFFSTEKQIQHARKRTLETIEAYKPRQCNIKIDGADHSGEFLLVEVMNTCLIGPNLDINPAGNIGDGMFEIVLVPGSDADKLKSFVENKLAGQNSMPAFYSLKGKKIEIKWKGARAHADDEIIKPGKWEPISIDLHNDMLRFLVPDIAV